MNATGDGNTGPEPTPSPPALKSESEVRKEVTALNERLGTWVFFLQEFRATAIAKRVGDLTEKES